MGYVTKMLLFGISLAFMLYLMGYGTTTTGLSLLTSGGWTSEAGLKLLVDSILAGFAVSLIAAGVSYFTSSETLTSWTILTGFISGFLFNFMLSPISMLGELGLPIPLNWFIGITINVFMVSAMITFIRGGD